MFSSITPNIKPSIYIPIYKLIGFLRDHNYGCYRVYKFNLFGLWALYQ